MRKRVAGDRRAHLVLAARRERVEERLDGARVRRASTGAFTWTPTSAQVGASTFTVRVTDNGTPALFAEESITVTVAALNHPPVLSPIGPRTVTAESTLSFTASATDPDAGQTLVYSLIGAPAGAPMRL